MMFKHGAGARWSSQYWGLSVKAVEDLVTILIAVLLVVVFDVGG